MARPHFPDVNRPTSLRTVWLLMGIMVLLVALSACGGDVDPQVLPMDPSPAARAPSDSQDSTPTSASAAPLPALSPRPTVVTTPSLSGQSNSPRDPVKAPGFSLMSGLGDRVTLDALLEGQDAVVVVNGGEIMYRQGGSRAEMWRLKSVPPVAFNQERPNLTEGGLDVQGGYLPPCSQGLFRRRDERPRGGPSVRATPGHGAQDARVLRAPRVSTATTGSQTEARSI